MKNNKLKLQSETIRFLSQREMLMVNGGGICSTTTTISQERCPETTNCGGTGGTRDTHEFPCTIMTY